MGRLWHECVYISKNVHLCENPVTAVWAILSFNFYQFQDFVSWQTKNCVTDSLKTRRLLVPGNDDMQATRFSQQWPHLWHLYVCVCVCVHMCKQAQVHTEHVCFVCKNSSGMTNRPSVEMGLFQTPRCAHTLSSWSYWWEYQTANSHIFIISFILIF